MSQSLNYYAFFLNVLPNLIIFLLEENLCYDTGIQLQIEVKITSNSLHYSSVSKGLIHYEHRKGELHAAVTSYCCQVVESIDLEPRHKFLNKLLEVMSRFSEVEKKVPDNSRVEGASDSSEKFWGRLQVRS